MNENKGLYATSVACKDCREGFFLSDVSAFGDVLRGLSVTSRCPSCRRAKGASNRRSGLSYWPVPLRGPSASPGRAGQASPAAARVHANVTLPGKRQNWIPGAPVSEEVARKFAAIDPAVGRILENVRDPHGKRFAILEAPPGSGKSVWLAYRLWEWAVENDSRVLVTQPRLATLRSKDGTDSGTTPGYVAEQLIGTKVGQGHEVGVRYRGESSRSDGHTRLLFVTDGILINWILSGEIGRFGVIVVDEAHEQSRNMELIFMLLKLRAPDFDDLKVVLASATLDTDRFRAYFGGGDPSRCFHAALASKKTPQKLVERWPDAGPDGAAGFAALLPDLVLPTSAERLKSTLPAAVAAVVSGIRNGNLSVLGHARGDALVFVPRVSDVDRCVDAVRALGLAGVEAYPCHAQMTDEESARFREGERRATAAQKKGRYTSPQRIIIGTNYPETGVSLSNLRFVIDSGWVNEVVWDPDTCSYSARIVRATKASCVQRGGRGGRMLEAEVFRLYPFAAYRDDAEFPPYPGASIARESLDTFLLAAKRAGVWDLDSVDWIGFDRSDPVQVRERARATENLRLRGAVDDDGDLTPSGAELSGIQAPNIDEAELVRRCDLLGLAPEITAFLSFLGAAGTPFVEGGDGLAAYLRWKNGCADDLDAAVRLVRNWETAGENKTPAAHARWSGENGLNHGFFLSLADARERLLRQYSTNVHRPLTQRRLNVGRLHVLRIVIARALPEWLFARCDDGGYEATDPACPVTRRIEIGVRSAALGAAAPALMVPLVRAVADGRFVADCVVRVEPEWVSGPGDDDYSRLLVLVARTRGGEEGDRARRTATVVESRPGRAPAPPVKAGDPIAFTLLGTPSREAGRGVALARRDDSGAEFVVRSGSYLPAPGGSCRAVVVGADGHGVVDVDPDALVRRLVPGGSETEGRVVETFGGDDPSRPTHARVSLGDGMSAVLARAAYGRHAARFDALRAGVPVRVRVEHTRDGSVRLRPLGDLPSAGETIEAVVVGYHFVSREPAVSGLRIDVGPFVRGDVWFEVPVDKAVAEESAAIGSKVRVSFVGYDRTVYPWTATFEQAAPRSHGSSRRRPRPAWPDGDASGEAPECRVFWSREPGEKTVVRCWNDPQGADAREYVVADEPRELAQLRPSGRGPGDVDGEPSFVRPALSAVPVGTRVRADAVRFAGAAGRSVYYFVGPDLTGRVCPSSFDGRPRQWQLLREGETCDMVVVARDDCGLLLRPDPSPPDAGFYDATVVAVVPDKGIIVSPGGLVEGLVPDHRIRDFWGPRAALSPGDPLRVYVYPSPGAGAALEMTGEGPARAMQAFEAKYPVGSRCGFKIARFVSTDKGRRVTAIGVTHGEVRAVAERRDVADNGSLLDLLPANGQYTWYWRVKVVTPDGVELAADSPGEASSGEKVDGWITGCFTLPDGRRLWRVATQRHGEAESEPIRGVPIEEGVGRAVHCTVLGYHVSPKGRRRLRLVVTSLLDRHD